VEASELLRFVRGCCLEIFARSRVFMAQGKQPEYDQGAGGNGEQGPHGEPKSITAMDNDDVPERPVSRTFFGRGSVVSGAPAARTVPGQFIKVTATTMAIKATVPPHMSSTNGKSFG